MRKSLDLSILKLLVYLVSLSGAFAITAITPSYADYFHPPVLPRDRQADPNGDRFPQKLPLTAPLPAKSPVEYPKPQTESVPSAENIQVTKIKVIGSTVLGTKDLNPIIQKVAGRAASITELSQVADAITQLYLAKGYVTSRAIFTNPATSDGILEIRVIEGSLSKIEVVGTSRLNPEYIRSRIRLGVSQPLNTNKLEDQLRLLRADPLLKKVEASLQAGTNLGESILLVKVIEASAFTANLSIDNYSPPSIGSERLGLNIGYRNPTGLGDFLNGSYYHTTTSGADIFDFSYTVPLNAMNGTLQLRVAPSSNKVTDAKFSSLNISGDSQLYEVSYRQPLMRTSRSEFALSVGFSYQDGQTFTFAGATPFSIGPDNQGNSRTRTIKFGQDFLHRDLSGAWSLRSLFSFGVDVFDPTINSSNIPDGRFFAWLGQIQRVQTLSQDNFFIFQLETQLTPDGLLPAQQFIIGGGQSVRGYRQNVRAGDNGFRVSLEDRQTILRDQTGASMIQLAPHFDLGQVWNVSDNPNKLQSQTFLAGLGLGLVWQALPQLNIRVDTTFPLINLSDRGTNAQIDGFYFSANYQM